MDSPHPVKGSNYYNLNERTINNERKHIVKHLNTLVAQHFFPTKLTTTWNVLLCNVVSSRTVNTFNNRLDKHWVENPPDVGCTGLPVGFYGKEMKNDK